MTDSGVAELEGPRMFGFRIAALGPMIVGGREGLQLRDRTVLGVLLVRGPTKSSTDQIGFALWGDGRPASYRKVIQGSVVRLRQVLGVDAIRTVDDGYRLDLAAEVVDVSCFEGWIEAARQQLAAGHAERAAGEVRRALELWRGPPMPELEGWPPREVEARRLESVRESAIDLMLEAMIAAGHVVEVADEGERLVEETPYREQRWALWARGLYAAGRQAEALATLRRLRCLLRDELGIDPSPDVAVLELAILQQDPALEIEPAVVPGTPCPWRGLLPYEPRDATDFFGREAEIETCLTRLRRSKRLLVVGQSGCGKSSFVRAGLIPVIGAEGEPAWLMTPGPHPIAGLRGVGPDSLVVVDQAEETLTQCCDIGERQEFFERLSRHRGRVIVVVRADLLDELTAYAGFAELLEGSLFVLRPLDEPGLRGIVEGPAARAGLRLEPGLVELLVGECRDEPGALPLLSHALAETWHRVEGNALTVDGYRRSGGIRAAIANSAEEVYNSLDLDQREGMRRLFRRLVSIDGGQPVRARVQRQATDADLAERLLAARLLTVADDGELQLAHEQLARHWPRLTEWISDDLEGQRVLRHLAGEAREWEESGRPVGSLYRGVRLAAALSWAAEHVDELTDAEKQFLDASQLAAESELRQARQSNTRLRIALVASVVLLVAAIGGGAIALHQRRTAERARDAAQQAGDYSEALRVGGLAESAHDPSVAFALAAEALRIDSSRASRVQVLEVFGRFSALLSTGEAPADFDWPAAVPAEAGGESTTSPDGKLLAESDASQILLLEASTREVLGAISDLPTTPNALAFDTTGRFLAGGLSEVGFGDTGTTIVWNVAERREIARFDSGDGEVWAHRFDPAGETVYSFGADGLHRWDLTGSHSIVRTQTGAPTSFRTGDDLLSLWDDSTTAWVIEACRLAGRPITEDEWQTYIGAEPYEPACREIGG